MTPGEWITLGGILLVQLVAIIGGWIKAGKDTDLAIAGIYKAMYERTRETDQQFSDLRGDFRALNAEAAIYWKRVAVDAGARIHRPHEEAKKMDSLLDEYTNTIMTPARLEELKVRLRAKVLDMKPEEGEDVADIPERQRDAALMLHAEKQRDLADPSKTVTVSEHEATKKETP